MTSRLLSNQSNRCSSKVFFFWTIPWIGLLAWGGISVLFCLTLGLNQTNMSNIFPFGLWIVWDLAVIALGAGAFFTGFLLYLIGKNELKDLINVAVIIGIICYSTAMGLIAVDLGQPVRSWFIFWHANIHSMLTEVSFCITIYMAVLIIEYLPIILNHRIPSHVRGLGLFKHNLHRIMAVFAATGAYLSFFHQGSLGGMFGVLYARPFVERPTFYIWPTTFFLFVLSAIAVGPCFTIICIRLTEILTRKNLAPTGSLKIIARISGWLLVVYLILKIADSLYWAYGPLPDTGFRFIDIINKGGYGICLWGVELILGGLLPSVLLVYPGTRAHTGLLLLASSLAVFGLIVNRFIIVIVNLALPVMPFDRLWNYLPNWQEWGVTAAFLGYGVLLFSFSYRYLNLFPKEEKPAPY